MHTGLRFVSPVSNLRALACARAHVLSSGPKCIQSECTYTDLTTRTYLSPHQDSGNSLLFDVPGLVFSYVRACTCFPAPLRSRALTGSGVGIFHKPSIHRSAPPLLALPCWGAEDLQVKSVHRKRSYRCFDTLNPVTLTLNPKP